MIGCIYRRTCIPATLLELSSQVATRYCSPIAAAADRLTTIMARLAKLRHDIARAIIASHTQILAVADAIDLELSEWVKTLSPTCFFDVLVNPGTFDVNREYKLRPYKRRCYVYSGISLANVWNNYRFMHIMVSDIILTHLRPLATSEDTEPSKRERIRSQCSDIRDRMRQLADDICHSAPDILGLIRKDGTHSQVPLVRSSVGGFLLLWPLSISATVDSHPTPLSDWVSECLHIIAHAMGIHQAIALRKVLPSIPDSVSWVDKLDAE
jgi:hypothetical protein